MALLGRDKARAEVGKVCAQNLSRQDFVTVIQSTREQPGIVE